MSATEAETERLNDLLRGKVVKVVRRHRPEEVMIEFTDGTRFFINRIAEGLDFSVT